MGDFAALGLFAPEPLAAEHVLTGFDCGVASMNDWLCDMALHNQRENYTRTFVTRTEDMSVRGYFSLCTGMLMRSDAPKSAVSRGAPRELPVALLARLAVHRELQGKGVGEILMRSALKTAIYASQKVAFRGVVVDALDQKAGAFYLRLGFVPTKINPLKLIMPSQHIIATLAAAGDESE